MTPPDARGERPSIADRYRVLLETGRTLAGTLAPDELYQAIHRETAATLEAEGFYISLYDQGRDLARVVFYADKGEVERVDVSYRGSDSEVIRTQQPSIVHDELESHSLMTLGDGRSGVPRSAVTAPMIHNGRVMGAISAQSYDPDAYSDEDLDLLQGIADVAAVAINNSQQFAELERRRREAEQLEEIGRSLSAELDPKDVLDQIVGAVLVVLSADGSSVWLCDSRPGDVARVAASAGEIRLPLGIEWHIEGELAGTILEERRPVILDDIAASELVPAYMRDHLKAGSAIGVPITLSGSVAGILTAGSRQPRHFSRDDCGVMQRLASQGAVALGNAQLHADLQALSLTDPLTGLPNRRRLQMHLETEVAAARRGRPLAVALFDIDNFKHYNDTFGHVAGDEILKAVAHVIHDENRAMNLAARYGGDEFVVVLSESSMDGVDHYVARVTEHVASDDTLKQFGISISVGAATFDTETMATANDILRAADANMYQSKAERHGISGGAPH